MEKTWLDKLQPGDKVVFHSLQTISIRTVKSPGEIWIDLEPGYSLFSRKNGYSIIDDTFISPYYPQLDGILPLWREQTGEKQ